MDRGRVLVVGGGIAGLSAAVEAAEAGCDVVLVERQAHLGGRVAQMHQYFPKLCPPLCGLELNLRRIRNGNTIECLTLAEVEEIEQAHRGEGLRVTVRQRPRMVTEQCSACGKCLEVCPVERENPMDFGVTSTKAIFLPHAAAYPSQYAIDTQACPGKSCGRCIEACPLSAIDLSMTERVRQFDVQAVIWATGWEPYDAKAIKELGFGSHPDILTNMMFERLASPEGPTHGKILCPSDGRVPKKVAFVQCAGSRDQQHLEYCSGVCCLASAKQTRYLRAAYPDVEISVHYIDRRATGNYERFLATAVQDDKTQYIAGKVAKVERLDAGLCVEFEDIAEGRRQVRGVDLVVLATGMIPSRIGSGIARQLERDAYGFFSPEQPQAGLFAVGCARQPMDASTAVRDATSAVGRALGCCHCAQSSGASTP